MVCCWLRTPREWFVLLGVEPCGVSVLVGGSLAIPSAYRIHAARKVTRERSQASHAPSSGTTGRGPTGDVAHASPVLHCNSDEDYTQLELSSC